MAAPLTPTSLTFRGKQINGIDLETLTDANDKLPASGVIYNELIEEGMIQYGEPIELMISGSLENQQFCDNPPDLRGLTFYVKYENYFHKYIPITDSHISVDNWGSTEGYLTTTITYTEDGVGVSNTISAYCVPESFNFASGDFNPEGADKSEILSAFNDILSPQYWEERNTSYSQSSGHKKILGHDNVEYAQQIRGIITTETVGDQTETSIRTSISGLYQYPGASSKSLKFFSVNPIYGSVGVTASGTAQGFRCKTRDIDWGNYCSIGWKDYNSSEMLGYMVNANGRTMDTPFTKGTWTSADDWHVRNFHFTIDARSSYSVVFGSLDSVRNVLDAKASCPGGMTFTFSHAINNTGYWAIQENSGTPFSIDSTLNSYSGNIIPANTDIIMSYFYLKRVFVKIIASSDYPASSWVCSSDSEIPKSFSYSLTPYYHFKSTHGSGIIKNLSFGTSLTYTDKNGISSTITGIKEISWGSGITVKYTDTTEHTLTITPDEWLRSYNLTIVANPTRSDGSTKY